MQKILLWILLALSLWLSWFTLFDDKCNMEGKLVPVIQAFVDTMDRHKIDYFMDDGSLLGAWRDKGVISFDFDIDVSIFFNDYDKVHALKSYFKDTYGYTLYGQYDYIFTKAWQRIYALEWNPYIYPSPCMRIYDQNDWIYIDVYCNTLVTQKEMLEQTKWPPQGYDLAINAGKKYYCTKEPDPGCCRFEEWITPLKKMSLFDRSVSIPNNVIAVSSITCLPNV